MKYKWLMFDADGTLFDYDRAEAEALKNTFQSVNVPFSSEYLNIYRSVNKQLWLLFEKAQIEVERLKVQRFEELIQKLGYDINPNEMSKNYLINLSKCSYLLDGAELLLSRFEKSVNMILITNGLKDVQRPRLVNSFINKFFNHIIISEEVGAAKPSPIIFDEAFKIMNYPSKDDVLIIGDNLTSDIKGGNDYGIDTCWFNQRSFKNELNINSTFEIKELNELIEIIS